jgi:hypothetical protein
LRDTRSAGRYGALFPANIKGTDIWLAGHLNGQPDVTYLVPKRLTKGVTTLLASAVYPQVQGCGHGTVLLRLVEALLTGHGQQLRIIEILGLR